MGGGKSKQRTSPGVEEEPVDMSVTVASGPERRDVDKNRVFPDEHEGGACDKSEDPQLLSPPQSLEIEKEQVESESEELDKLHVSSSSLQEEADDDLGDNERDVKMENVVREETIDMLSQDDVFVLRVASNIVDLVIMEAYELILEKEVELWKPNESDSSFPLAEVDCSGVDSKSFDQFFGQLARHNSRSCSDFSPSEEHSKELVGDNESICDILESIGGSTVLSDFPESLQELPEPRMKQPCPRVATPAVKSNLVMRPLSSCDRSQNQGIDEVTPESQFVTSSQERETYTLATFLTKYSRQLNKSNDDKQDSIFWTQKSFVPPTSNNGVKGNNVSTELSLVSESDIDDLDDDECDYPSAVETRRSLSTVHDALSQLPTSNSVSLRKQAYVQHSHKAKQNTVLIESLLKLLQSTRSKGRNTPINNTGMSLRTCPEEDEQSDFSNDSCSASIDLDQNPLDMYLSSDSTISEHEEELDLARNVIEDVELNLTADENTESAAVLPERRGWASPCRRKMGGAKIEGNKTTTAADLLADFNKHMSLESAKLGLIHNHLWREAAGNDQSALVLSDDEEMESKSQLYKRQTEIKQRNANAMLQEQQQQQVPGKPMARRISIL